MSERKLLAIVILGGAVLAVAQSAELIMRGGRFAGWW